MRIVFSHQNFPAQFGEFGGWLARLGWTVVHFTAAEDATPIEGCGLVKMRPHRAPAPGVHRYAAGMERAMINAQAFARTAIALRRQGFVPDVVVAHSGWGSGTLAKAVWPECRFVPYLEWWYRYPAADALDDAPEENVEDARARALTRNAPVLLDLEQADLALCPTAFQAEQFPPERRKLIRVLHDGVDVVANAPEPGARMDVGGRDLSGAAEVITYATRGMEPHRGFPEFMRAVARLQRVRPGLHVVIGGEDRVAYGAKLPEGDSWKTRMLAELDLDLSRLHFTGLMTRADFRRMLQATQVHVYLTVPFVLSWSLLEAMAVGCPIVASDVAPVREALTDGRDARLVDHRDVDALVAAIATLLDSRDEGARLGAAARAAALARYDRRWIWPARAELLRALARRPPAVR